MYVHFWSLPITSKKRESPPYTRMSSCQRCLIVIVLATLQVSLGEDPSLVIIPDRIMKPVGTGVYLSCKAQVDDADLVTEMSWTAPSGEKITNVNDDLYTISTAEDGTMGKLDLIITSLMEQDVGVYTCSAIYAGNHKLDAKVTVESYMEIDFGDTPTHQSLLIGKEGKVRCTPRAKPPPQVDWFKNLEPLENDHHLIIRQDGILISEVTEADEGTYRCRARVPVLGSVKHLEIQVEAYMPPSITKPPLNTTGRETEDATFECSAIGKPAPEYSWVDNNNSPIQNGGDFHMNADTGVLLLMNLKPEQSGEYRCTASNHAGDDFKTAFLQVYSKPKIEEYLNVTSQVGNDLEMKCIMSGDPPPRVVFKKESESMNFTQGFIPDTRIRVEQKQDEHGRQVASLHIDDVGRQDDGLYTCTAVSEGGVAQQWGHVTVEFSPTFEEQPDTEFWSWENSPVNLTCLATSIPNATIQWYLHDEEIERHDVNVERLELGPLGVLRVHPVSSRYFGFYTCEASNTLGTASLQVELKEARLPGYVISSRVEKKTATTITWRLVEPSDNGGLPIQSFLVEYRRTEQSWEDAALKTWNKGSTYTIENLTPLFTYVFRFAARSQVGIGPWSAEKSEEMPGHAVPEEPLIFDASNTLSPYANHYELQWKVPLSNGREIDFFQIIYYQVENKDGEWEGIGKKTKHEVKYPGTTSHRIENLQSDSHYKIELRAHNDIGFSTPAEIIIKTSPGSNPVTEQDLKKTHIGIIVGIVMLGIIVIVLLVDIICCCTRKAGLFARLSGRRRDKKKDVKRQRFDSENIREGYPIDDFNVNVNSWTPDDAAAAAAADDDDDDDDDNYYDDDDDDKLAANTTAATDWKESSESTPMMIQRLVLDGHRKAPRELKDTNRDETTHSSFRPTQNSSSGSSSEMLNSNRSGMDRTHITEPIIVGYHKKIPQEGNIHWSNISTQHGVNDVNRNPSNPSLNYSYSSDDDPLYAKPFDIHRSKDQLNIPLPQSRRNEPRKGMLEGNLDGKYLEDNLRNKTSDVEENAFGRSEMRYPHSNQDAATVSDPFSISENRDKLFHDSVFRSGDGEENSFSRSGMRYPESNQDVMTVLDSISISDRRDKLFQPPILRTDDPEENRFGESEMRYFNKSNQDPTTILVSHVGALSNGENLPISVIRSGGVEENKFGNSAMAYPESNKGTTNISGNPTRNLDNLHQPSISKPKSTEPKIIKPTRPLLDNLSRSREALEVTAMSDQVSKNTVKTVGLNGLSSNPLMTNNTDILNGLPTTKPINTPAKPPSVASYSTLYQTADTATPQYTKTQIAYKIAPYDEPCMPTNNLSKDILKQDPQTKATSQSYNIKQSERDMEPSIRTTPPWAPKNYDNWRIPPPPLPVNIPKRKDKKPLKQHSFSMENLDVSIEDNNLPNTQAGSPPHNLPLTKSLNNLLDDPSLRSYGKPTLL